MSDHTERPAVPEPRGRGDDEPGTPLVPAPRAAPAIERVPGPHPAPVPSPRPAEARDQRTRTTGLRVPAGAALAVRPSWSHTLSERAGGLVRIVARAVGSAVDALRTAVGCLAALRPPAPQPLTAGGSRGR